MVEWKGDITCEESGGKAARLDSVELNVPNFFTLTRSEIAELVGEIDSPEEVINSQFGDTWEKVEKAHDEIGMSSEVREASGKARNLVGGQRNGQLVSVRISGDRKGVFDCRLNVGSSELENAVKEVIASYYQVETEEEHPAVIIQQMVEPGYSGAAVTDYLGNHRLMEAVEGFGVSLEEGVTTPALYLVGNSVEDRRVPDQQVVVERNQMDGSHQKKRIRPEPPFSEEEIKKLFRSLDREDVNAKFVYKRGSFYITDIFESKSSSNPFDTPEASLEGIRVSEGEMEGRVGEEVLYSEEPELPQNYREAIISRKGGYTSTGAQLARQEGKPAIFSFRGELENGQHVSISSREVSAEGERTDTTLDRDMGQVPKGQTASEVLPIDSGNGIYLSPPFSRARYAVTDRHTGEKSIPRSGHLTSYRQIFAFEGDKAVLDARKLEREGLEPAIEYLDADLKVLLFDYPDPEAVRTAIEAGFDVFGSSRNFERLEDIVARQEKKFMLEQLRELSK